MTLLRNVVQRFRALLRELTKFGLIGIVNTLLHLAVWNTLFYLGPIKAQVIATVISATSSYFMNRHWTFRHRVNSGLRREYTLFFAFNAVGLVITGTLLGLATYVFGIKDLVLLNIVNIFAIGVATLFRFWSYRRWVFLHPEDALYAAPIDPGRPTDEIASTDGTPGTPTATRPTGPVPERALR